MKFLGVQWWWTPEVGCKPALVWEARIKVHIVYFDGGAGIVKRKRRKSVLKQLRPLDYPPKKCAKSFRRIGRERGITKGAKDMLRRIA